MIYLQLYKIMKFIFKILFLLNILFVFSSVQTLNKEKTNKPFIVVIDAGHGGYDSGAIGYNGIKEKDINLDIALITKFLLEKHEKNIKVVLTRKKDIFIPLKKRAEIAKYFKADLFISIHCDANYNHKARGAGIFIMKKLSKKNYTINNYKKTLKFALSLKGILSNNLNLKVRNIEFTNFSVLRNTFDMMPSILVETGFITNKTEALYFEEKGKKGLSYSLFKAISKFKNEQFYK